MSESSDKSLKEKAVEEGRKIVLYTAYLAMIICSFNFYRMLVLAEYNISYLHFGYGLLEALVLAKVVLIGEALHVGERWSDRPLIVPTLFKSVAFGLLAVVFAVLEHLVIGVIHRRDLAEIWTDVISKGRDEIIARIVIMVVAFIPFFALTELSRVMGESSLFTLFFREPPAASSSAKRSS